jgi:hypothetical protein
MKRFGQAAVFIILLALSLSIPLMIEAIFPGGRSAKSATPPEEPVSNAAPATSAVEDARLRDNVAWLRGDGGSVLDAGDASLAEAAEEAATESEEPANAESENARLDLRPGLWIGYTRSWDSLDIRREQFAAGAFVFISSHTRIDLSGARLRFRDDVDKIYGEAVRIDGAHRLGNEWLLEEGVEHDDYDHLHDSWNGNVRLSGALSPKVGIAVEGSRRDMWERLANIRNKLRLWEAGLSVFYQLLPRWWLSAMGTVGWYTDHNARLSPGAEIGYVLSPKAGLSLATGVEMSSFREQRDTYWSPNYYHYVYGRLRLSRDYERQPFEPQRTTGGWRGRLGYLAEVTAGVNDEGHAEVSERAGLEVRPVDRLTLRAEFYHLDAEGRFDDTYAENRVDGRAEVRF